MLENRNRQIESHKDWNKKTNSETEKETGEGRQTIIQKEKELKKK